MSITGTNLKSIGFVRFAGNDARIFGEGASDTYLSVEVPQSAQAGEVPLIVQTRDGSAATTFVYV